MSDCRPALFWNIHIPFIRNIICLLEDRRRRRVGGDAWKLLVVRRWEFVMQREDDSILCEDVVAVFV